MLAELVMREGYALVIDDAAPDHPEAMGTPQRDELCAQACANNVVRMRSGLRERDAWYPVSHEIAEDRCDFSGHTQKMFREQLNILCRWLARMSARLDETKRERDEYYKAWQLAVAQREAARKELEQLVEDSKL